MTDHSPEGIAKLVKSLRQVAVTPINLDAGETWIDEWVREKFQAAAEALERLAGGRDEARRNALDELLSLDEASVGQQDGVVTFAGRGKVVPILATALYEVLASVSATNYVELRLGATNPQTDIEDPLVLRLQREQGKTPDQLKREAEERAARLEAGLRYIYLRGYTGAASIANDVLEGKDLPDDDYRIVAERNP